MIDELVLACEWFPNPYFLFSGNVFSNLIYYSHLTPILVSLALGAYVYFSNRKSLVNKALFLITLILGMWLLLDLVLWATDSIRLVMFTWTMVNLIEPMIYAGFLYFIYIFILGRDVGWKTKTLIVLPLLPTIFATGTGWNVLGFDLTNCDREVIEGPIAFYNYAIEIGYSIWIFLLGAWALFRKVPVVQKRQTTLVVIATLILLLGFASGNIIGSFSEDWTIGQFGLFVLPLCVGTLSYFVIQFRFFAKSQLAGIQMLIIALWIAVGSILFIQSLEYARWIVGATLVFLTLIGYLLVKGIKKEIEQRRQIEKLAGELGEANDRLKELDQMKSEFLSIASHQLRAPITAVRGYAANINEGAYGEVPAHLKEPLDIVQESARLMANSIEDYLNISRIEQGRMKYEKSQFDIADLAKKVVTELTPVAAKRGLTLVANAPEDLLVNADVGKMKQVIVNLVDNAIKYTKQGGVTVSVETVAGSARITISDTGVGIATDEIDGLFEKFKRARGANKVNTTGTGLGLYVAKQLVEGHSGKVWAESDGAGKGSRFIVELPL